MTIANTGIAAGNDVTVRNFLMERLESQGSFRDSWDCLITNCQLVHIAKQFAYNSVSMISFIKVLLYYGVWNRTIFHSRTI